MTLYDQRKFNLDDDISEHLGFPVKHPKFPEKIITIRQLLSHTSSFREVASYNDFL